MPNKRLPADVLQEDLAAFAGLLALENYTPSNSQYTLSAVKAIKEAMEANQTSETQKISAANAARDDSIANEREFHNLILGVKDQVKAQYGKDSNQLQSLGLKKKSDYKTGRKKTRNAGNP
jgi:hypothetical protein